MTIRAVVFDLDGTLVETAPDLHAVMATVLEEEGCPVPALAEVRRMVGNGARALLQRGFAAAGQTLEGARLERLYARFLEIYVAAPCRFSFAYPGVDQALEHLAAAGLGLGICTNKPQRPTELLLDALDLRRHFRSIVGGDVLATRKPDPAHLHAVLDALGVSPGESALVGDSRNDSEAARAAGAACILVSFGYTDTPAIELGADRVIDHFHELPEALASLGRMA